MSRGEKRVFLLVLALLLVSLTMMVLQTVTGTDTPKVHQITVLLDGAGDEYWQTFRKGISQAAQECNVDVRYISRYESSVQSAALKQEWEGEADGVVIVPMDGLAVGKALAQSPQSLVVSVVGPEVPAERGVGYISADNGEMGRALADAVYLDGWRDCVVVLSGDAGVAALARKAGFSARLMELGGRLVETASDNVPDVAIPAGSAVVAMEPSVTEALCQRVDAAGQVYGMGASNRLLRHLEDGQAAALVVQSDYTAGYLSLLSVVDALEGKPQKSETLACYTVTRENMFTEPLIQLLFPIS